MLRLFSILFAVLLILWVLCSGIHWAGALAISLISCLGACAVWGVQHPVCSRYIKSPDHKLWFGCIAPFQGFGPLGWFLVAAIILTLLSLIPLPLGVLAVLSPKVADLYTEADALLGTNSLTWGCLSASPGRTAYALVMLCGFWGLYTTTCAISGERKTMIFLIRAMVIAAACIVAMLAMKYAGFEIAFGQIGQSSPMHIGLPVNPNHTAGIMALMSLMALGMSFTHRHRDIIARRGIWLLIYIVFSVALIMLKSRGAILGWGLGHLVLIASLWLSKRSISLRYCMIAVAAVFIVIGAIVFVSSPIISSIKAEFEETPIVFDTSDNDPSDADQTSQKNFSKTQMYGDFWRMSRDWAITGTGRSAFADIYPQYQGFPFSKVFRHAENEYWEIILEYGWIAGFALLILGFIGFIAFFKTFLKSPDERAGIYGVLAGVIAVLIQNCFDFSLRYWTVAVPFWISCGILEGRRRRWILGKQNVADISQTKKNTIQMTFGCIVLIIGTITILSTTRLWYDGITESGIEQLSVSIAHRDNPDEIVQILSQNLKTRPASTAVRKQMGNKLIRDASESSDDEEKRRLYQQAHRWYSSAHLLAPHDPYIMLHLAKLCMALDDENCAVSLLYRTAADNPNLRSLALGEAAKLKDETLQLPKDTNTLRTLVSALLQYNRIQTVQNLIETIPNDDEHQSLIAELSCKLYDAIDFPEGCDLIAERIKNDPVTPATFQIRVQSLARNHKYADLFKYLENVEHALREDESYWRQRLYYSVFFGKDWDPEWYKKEIPQLFLQYRNVASHTANYRFYQALYDAKYALELGQLQRAARSASQAIALRPNHKLARSLQQEIKQRQEETDLRRIMMK